MWLEALGVCQTRCMSSLSLRDDLQLGIQKRAVIVFSHILEEASRGNLLNWGMGLSSNRRLSTGLSSRAETLSRFQSKLRDVQVMAEFRSKLRTAEDLISKLGYSLREITDQRD